MSTFYVKTLNTWTKFICYVNPSSKEDAYEEQLSGNKNITFNGKPLFMSNFAKSGFKREKRSVFARYYVFIIFRCYLQ